MPDQAAYRANCVVCSVCGAEWEAEALPPCVHLDLDSDWDGK